MVEEIKKFSLGDLVEIKHGYAFKGENFTDDGSHVVLTPGNFYEEGGFKRKDQEKWYTGDIPEDYILNENDLIVAMTEQAEGLLGSSALVPNKNLYLHNQRLGLVEIIDQSLLDKKYLYYLFNTYIIRDQIKATASGTKVRHTSPSRIYEAEVEIPSIETQQKIASILSAFDDLIENNTRRIVILEEMARLIYREWFVYYRYPGHENDRLVDSGTELGEVPEGWSVKELGDAVKINKGKNITKRKANIDGDVLVVAGGLEPAYMHDTPNTKHPVITISASGANAGYVNLYEADVWASDCSYIDTRATDDVYYFYCLMKERQHDIFHMQHGSAQPHVYPKDLNRLKVANPFDQLIRKFTLEATPIFSQIKVLEKQNRKLKETRDLLLPNLIAGKVEV